MLPELRFHSIVVSLTTSIVFVAWLILSAIIAAYPLVTVALSALISLGVYRAVALALLALLRNWQPLKAFILGPYYMEGTWVGFFVGHDGEVRLFIETFEQDLSSIVIRGRVFHEDGEYHGSWIATNAQVDVKIGRLAYSYEADVVGNTFLNPGIATFTLERPASHKAPERMAGYSSDLFSPRKLMAFEEKVSNATMVEAAYGFDAAKRVHAQHAKRLQQ